MTAVVSQDHAGPQAENRLLARLSQPDLALLSPHFVTVALEQGTLLHEAGDVMDTVFFPQSGMISLLAVMRAGNGVETATVGREGAVGMLTALGSRTAVARAVIQLAGRFSQIAVSNFAAAAQQSVGIRDLSIRYHETHIALVHHVAGCNALHPMEARLCRWLLQARDRTDTDKVPLTHEFLSEMLGAQRSTVTMLARKLQQTGLIRYVRGQIEIVDRARLEETACECYGIVRQKMRAAFAD